MSTVVPIKTSDRRRAILTGIVTLVMRKNRAYGADNIIKTGVIGIAVRLVDKVYRFNTLADKTIPDNGESRRDTLRDIVGYCLIGELLINDKWGKATDALQMDLLRVVGYVTDYRGMDTRQIPPEEKLIQCVSDLYQHVLDYRREAGFDEAYVKSVLIAHLRGVLHVTMGVLEED